MADDPVHLGQVAVLPDPFPQRRGSNPWLIGVELPDVKIHEEWRVHRFYPAVHSPPHQPVWKLAEVIAPGDRQRPAAKGPRREWKLPNLLVADSMKVGPSPPWSPGVAPEKRPDARVVGKTFLGQDVESPVVMRSEPLVANSEAEDLCAGSLLKGLTRADQIIAELLPAEMRHAVVKVAFARHLVTPNRNLTNQLRHLIGDGSEDEECGVDVVLVEEVKGLAGVGLDPPLESIPPIGPNDALERRDVEVVFHDDGEEVGTGRSFTCVFKHRIGHSDRVLFSILSLFHNQSFPLSS